MHIPGQLLTIVRLLPQDHGSDGMVGQGGVGLRFEDRLSGDRDPVSVSIKAWYGSDSAVRGIFGQAVDRFQVSSMRMRGSDQTVSEWYNTGRITFNASKDIDSVIYAVTMAAKGYRDSLVDATRLRDTERGSFEFEFDRKVNLEEYERSARMGKSSLKLWMVKTEESPGFIRLQGVDMHTWDRIFLSLAEDYAYMTVPVWGCVNAAPRMAAVQGETATGRTRIYYKGDEIFD